MRLRCMPFGFPPRRAPSRSSPPTRPPALLFKPGQKGQLGLLAVRVVTERLVPGDRLTLDTRLTLDDRPALGEPLASANQLALAHRLEDEPTSRSRNRLSVCYDEGARFAVAEREGAGAASRVGWSVASRSAGSASARRCGHTASLPSYSVVRSAFVLLQRHQLSLNMPPEQEPSFQPYHPLQASTRTISMLRSIRGLCSARHPSWFAKQDRL